MYSEYIQSQNETSPNHIHYLERADYEPQVCRLSQDTQIQLASPNHGQIDTKHSYRQYTDEFTQVCQKHCINTVHRVIKRWISRKR